MIRLRKPAAQAAAALLALALLLGSAVPGRADDHAHSFALQGQTHTAAPEVLPLPKPEPISLRQEERGGFTLYKLPTGKPWSIAQTDDGALWFTLEEPMGLLRIDPRTPTQGELYRLPSGMNAYLLTRGRQGTLWFTDFAYVQHPGTGHLVLVDPARGEMSRYAVPTQDAGPAAMSMSPDGNLWFTEMLTDRFGRLEPVTGTITEWSLPVEAGGRPRPYGILADQKQVLLVESAANNWDRFTPSAHGGQLTRHPMPPGLTGPTDIKPVGEEVWVTAHGSNEVLQVRADGSQQILRLHPPAGPGVSNPSGIGLSPRGIWIAEHEGNRLALLRPDQSIVEFTQPEAKTGAQWLQTTDSGVWYAAYGTQSIGFLPFAAEPALTLVGGSPAEPAPAEHAPAQPPSAALRQGGSASITVRLQAGREAKGEAAMALHVDRLPSGLTAEVQPAQLKLAPGAQADVRVTFHAANGADTGEFHPLLTADVGGPVIQVSQAADVQVRQGFLGLAWGIWGWAALLLLAVGFGLPRLRRRS